MRTTAWLCAAVLALASTVLASPTPNNNNAALSSGNAPIIVNARSSESAPAIRNEELEPGSVQILAKVNYEDTPLSVESAPQETVPSDTPINNILDRPGEPGSVLFYENGSETSCGRGQWWGFRMNKCADIDIQHWTPHNCIAQYKGVVCDYYNMEGCQAWGARYDSRGSHKVISPLPANQAKFKSFRCKK